MFFQDPNLDTQAIINSVLCGVVVFKLYNENGDFKLELINKEACKILGGDREKINASNFSLMDFVQPEHKKGLAKIIHYAFKEKGSTKFEFQCKMF